MLEFAISGHPQFSVNRMELARTGRSFTVDTLRQLHEEDPSRELFFLIGADSLADLPLWRDPAGIAELATIVAVNRGDRPMPDLDALRGQLGDAVLSRIQIVTMPGIDLSATDIRRRVRDGKSIRFMTPRACEVYGIQQHGLYRESIDPSHGFPPGLLAARGLSGEGRGHGILGRIVISRSPRRFCRLPRRPAARAHGRLPLELPLFVG